MTRYLVGDAILANARLLLVSLTSHVGCGGVIEDVSDLSNVRFETDSYSEMQVRERGRVVKRALLREDSAKLV